MEGAEAGFVDMPLLLRMKVYSPQQTHEDMLFHKNCQSTNPVERVFREVRRGLKHRVFATLPEAQERVTAVLQSLFNTRKMIVGLACFPYILNTTQKI